MSTFVILAAGRGSRLGRLGDALPKALLPLDDRAVLSHQIALAPVDAKIVIVVGYRADQVDEYINLAHPHLDVSVVHERNWGRGPGASLLEARDYVEGDLIFTACDTLWDHDNELWDDGDSWLGVAPIPAGTPAARWCRAVLSRYDDYVLQLDDKTPIVAPNSFAWTALGCVREDALDIFWRGLTDADQVAGEVQLSSGLVPLLDAGIPIASRHVRWLDVGDEQAYRSAVATASGYDALKPDQVTYVVNGRVVKSHVNTTKVVDRAVRAQLLGDTVPKVTAGRYMCAYDYVPGDTGYAYAERRGPVPTVTLLFNWWEDNFLSTRQNERPPDCGETSMKFYRDKTFQRVMSLPRALSAVALDAVTRIDWDQLLEGVVPGVFHGDLTYANVIITEDERVWAIDWREDFAGEVYWADLRYDLAKLLAGTYVHWENAARGDFRPWDDGVVHRHELRKRIAALGFDVHDIDQLAALCLLNSATLHASPLDEILVARGCRLLEAIL